MTEAEDSIPDATRLYRRLHPEQVVWDKNCRVVRASSAAFRDRHLSVNLGNEIERRNLTPLYVLDGHPQHSLGWFTAGFAREEEQRVESTPTEEDPTHGEVIGHKSDSRRTRFAKKTELNIVRSEFLRPEVREHLDASAEQGPDPDLPAPA